MAVVDAMDIDSSPAPVAVAEAERKRKLKHKNKDKTSKKKRKHDPSLISDETAVHDPTSKKSKSKGKSSKNSSETALPTSDSPYVLTTATLYLPLSPISISPTHALASLMAEHLSPLLLTYYPPLQGVILAYSNASISSEPPTSSSTASEAQDPNPQPLTLAKTADEYGVLYVYLTATFLIFRPQRGQILEGWVNVQSEGFLGAVVLNLFSVGIERKRLPSDWEWVPPGDEDEDSDSTKHNKKIVFSSTEDDADADEDSDRSPEFDPEREHFKPITLASDANPFSETADDENPTSAEDGGDDDSAAEGYFQSVSGHRVRGTVRFRVVDIDVIPGTDRERGFLSIEGTMLSPEEEAKIIEDERDGILSSATPRRPHVMSGSIGPSAAITEIELETVSVDVDADAGPSKSPSKRKEPKAEKVEKKEEKKKSKSSKSSKSKKEK
ncbi:DNA-directed RNA polymerase I subunit RPA43 [Aspergillus clavatus NRRL 1]|uniref:DNA-directed RNA polymerase subunit n=1 Tax=Aspergillus clavatus (strain ATCC 1007 / CBS 513.65 / DSM 816 / NCTC 3887 / NRRL 1 / QM 1276 / 107) TaxID=344612 RepID=A1CG30_ASPCL|nr:RNA polymerase I subunit Rpa43, putative [Aspergillus clavatus NRRL 1]EAW10910.1 RNA polymerase I subunit Rpa43, putative [Aspergillus clavatus NRRL 1]